MPGPVVSSGRRPPRPMVLRLLVVLVCTALVAAVSLVVPSALPSAHAATITFGAVGGRAHDQTGYTDAAFTQPTTAGQSCTKYSPTTGSGASTTSSAWVGAGGQALVSHGRAATRARAGD